MESGPLVLTASGYRICDALHSLRYLGLDVWRRHIDNSPYNKGRFKMKKVLLGFICAVLLAVPVMAQAEGTPTQKDYTSKSTAELDTEILP